MPTKPPRKAATNLSLRADLVRRARELGLNLSELVDQALERAIREEAEAKRWVDDNREAIAEYNARVARRGVFAGSRLAG